jgi:hypothetical protein
MPSICRHDLHEVRRCNLSNNSVASPSHLSPHIKVCSPEYWRMAMAPFATDPKDDGPRRADHLLIRASSFVSSGGAQPGRASCIPTDVDKAFTMPFCGGYSASTCLLYMRECPHAVSEIHLRKCEDFDIRSTLLPKRAKLGLARGRVSEEEYLALTEMAELAEEPVAKPVL